MPRKLGIADLKKLKGLGRKTKEVTLFGVKFKLRTISAEENLAAVEESTKYQDELTKFNILRLSLLARSVCEIDGMEVPPELRDQVKEHLRGTEVAAVSTLFSTYQELVNAQDEEMSPTVKLDIPANVVQVAAPVEEATEEPTQESSNSPSSLTVEIDPLAGLDTPIETEPEIMQPLSPRR